MCCGYSSLAVGVQVIFYDFFYLRQKTAYVMRISDWSSDVCSSVLRGRVTAVQPSSRIFTSGRPMLIIGSIVKIMPGFNSGPVPGRPAWRSEERRVGKECVRTCRSRWSPYHYKTKQILQSE